MFFDKYIYSRGVPKTGVDVVYETGDDGTFQTGWWIKRLLAANRTRYIVKTISGDVVVFDRATGLMWAADANEAGCNNGNTLIWTAALAYALGLDFAGFSDWRIPNVNELMSLLNYNLPPPMIDTPPFLNSTGGYCNTSTIRLSNQAFYWSVYFQSGYNAAVDKTTAQLVRCVRLGI